MDSKAIAAVKTLHNDDLRGRRSGNGGRRGLAILKVRADGEEVCYGMIAGEVGLRGRPSRGPGRRSVNFSF